MTESEFKKYMSNYGYHLQHVYGEDIIEKPGSNLFRINGKSATASECAELITVHKRGKIINDILNEEGKRLAKY